MRTPLAVLKKEKQREWNRKPQAKQRPLLGSPPSQEGPAVAQRKKEKPSYLQGNGKAVSVLVLRWPCRLKVVPDPRSRSVRVFAEAGQWRKSGSCS